MITTYLTFVFDAINEMFRHFRGIFLIFGVDILAVIIAGYGIIALLRFITNGSFAISKTIDIPREDSSVRSSSGWKSSGDTNDDVSKR